MRMKRCELCNSVAELYCESDQAILCWHCDTQVHSANFLVANHSRSLLCRLCQHPTPWSAAGTTLGSTASSICHRCLNQRRNVHGHNPETQDDEDEDEDEKTEDDEEYQVVPFSVSCSSQSRTKSESSSQGDLGSLFFQQDQDDVDCVSNNEATSSDTVVP